MWDGRLGIACATDIADSPAGYRFMTGCSSVAMLVGVDAALVFERERCSHIINRYARRAKPARSQHEGRRRAASTPLRGEGRAAGANGAQMCVVRWVSLDSLPRLGASSSDRPPHSPPTHTCRGRRGRSWDFYKPWGWHVMAPIVDGPGSIDVYYECLDGCQRGARRPRSAAQRRGRACVRQCAR